MWKYPLVKEFRLGSPDDQVFKGTTDGSNMFDMLTQLSKDMSDGNLSNVQSALDSIDQVSDQVRMSRGKIGNNAALVQTSMDQMQGTQTDLQATLSAIRTPTWFRC